MIQLRESWITCQTIKVLVACHTLKVQAVRRKIERNRSFSFFSYNIDAKLQTRFDYYLQPFLIDLVSQTLCPNWVLRSCHLQLNFAQFATNFEAAHNYFLDVFVDVAVFE